MRKFLHFISLLTILLTGCGKYNYKTVPPPPVIAPNDIVETEPHSLKGITVNINSTIGGYYEGLPAHYSQTTKLYPAIFFIHGGGQYGNGSIDLAALLTDGIPQLLDVKKFPPNVSVNGSKFSFIILTPQFSHEPSLETIDSFITYAKSNYRIDVSRMYLSGFSAGGLLTTDFAAFHASELAAIVPMGGASTYNVKEKCQLIAAANLPVWSFHNAEDMQISADDSRAFIDTINFFHPAVEAKLTLLPSFGILNHDAWTKATDPGYSENGINIYEWMLQYKR